MSKMMCSKCIDNHGTICGEPATNFYFHDHRPFCAPDVCGYCQKHDYACGDKLTEQEATQIDLALIWAEPIVAKAELKWFS